MDALKRIVRNYNGDMEKLKFIDMTYYILRKDGAYAGVSLWEGSAPNKPHTLPFTMARAVGGDSPFASRAISQEFPPFPTVLPEELTERFGLLQIGLQIGRHSPFCNVVFTRFFVPGGCTIILLGSQLHGTLLPRSRLENERSRQLQGP